MSIDPANKPEGSQYLEMVEDKRAQAVPAAMEAKVAYTVPAAAALDPLKYAQQLRDIAKCPPRQIKAEIGIAYRFAFADVGDKRNYLPIALLQPKRTTPGGKPIVDCCEAWSLSMFTTVDALQNKAKKAMKTSPMFLKRVGDCFTQIKLSPQCGEHTEPNGEGHFEFFERATFNGINGVIGHGKMAL